MSLDLYIKSKTPIIHRDTGIYIRKNGETKVLETKEDVLKHFPNANPEEIKVNSYEDDIYFHLNLTHNLGEMARHCNAHHFAEECSLYTLLWHPEELLSKTNMHPTEKYLLLVIDSFLELSSNEPYYSKYNPKNGWGNYEQLLNGVRNFSTSLLAVMPYIENYTIEASI